MVLQHDDKQAKKHGHRWQPGESGNPKGRPKASISLTSYLKQYLKKNPSEIRAVVLALIQAAKSGNYQALQELFNRIDGKVAEKHEHEAKLPVTLVFQPVIAREVLGQGKIIEGEYKELNEGTEIQE